MNLFEFLIDLLKENGIAYHTLYHVVMVGDLFIQITSDGILIEDMENPAPDDFSVRLPLADPECFDRLITIIRADRDQRRILCGGVAALQPGDRDFLRGASPAQL